MAYTSSLCMSGANIRFATTEDFDAIGRRNLLELSEIAPLPRRNLGEYCADSAVLARRNHKNRLGKTAREHFANTWRIDPIGILHKRATNAVREAGKTVIKGFVRIVFRARQKIPNSANSALDQAHLPNIHASF
jgi:hypothetical protein